MTIMQMTNEEMVNNDVIHNMVIAFIINIGPNQRGYRAQDEQYRIFLNKIPNA